MCYDYYERGSRIVGSLCYHVLSTVVSKYFISLSHLDLTT